MSARSAELFAWFRWPANDREGARAQSQHVRAQVLAACGIEGRLLWRDPARTMAPDQTPATLDTWMEHYPALAGAAGPDVAEVLAALALSEPALAQRHLEVFGCPPR